MSQQPQDRLLRFGVFEANLSSRELRKHGIRVRLRGQPFTVLAMLLEKPGRVLTREEMRQTLWASDTFVDFEHGLNSAIKKLRRALGDSPENSRYIETLPRIGYRFIAPVEEIKSQAGQPEPGAPATQEAPEGRAEIKPRQPRRWPVLAAIFVILLAAPAAYFRWRHPGAPSPQPKSRMMMAVFPFENLTGDPGQDYFSDGLTEEMTGRLGRLNPERLGVIARTSAMHYKRGGEQLERIGRELGVQYVLEGSVRRDAGRVRITAQLIQIKDQTPVWSHQYDRELNNLLSVQDEIAAEIASGIQLSLGEAKPISPTKQPSLSPEAYEAYDLYLRGRYYWNQRTTDGFRQAAEYFQKSIAKDPNYAKGYAGLAETYALMSTWYMVPTAEFMPKARTEALRALQIDDTVAEAHASLALIAETYDYDWQAAEKEFRRAIELDPASATAHQWYAESLSWQGRFEEALAESERARQLDPHSAIIAIDHGVILYLSRQYDRAIQQLRAAREMDPNNQRVNVYIVFAYLGKGQFTEAVADAEQYNPRNGRTFWFLMACIEGYRGRQAQAQQAVAKLDGLSAVERQPLAVLVSVCLSAGRRGEAMTLLEKAYYEHSPYLTTLKVDPLLDPLRSEARFQDLLRRVGLAH